MLAQVQADNEALRVKLEKLQKPPTNSNNSSQPPSRDQKRNKPAKRPKRKHGPPTGHVKYERRFVAEPDQIVPLQVTACPVCQTDLKSAPAVLVDVTQITEIPEPRALVVCTHRLPPRFLKVLCQQWRLSVERVLLARR